MVAETVPEKEQFLRREEFQAVFLDGRRVERPSVVLLWKGEEGRSKTGFAVSRQVRGVVSRNRARRRLREAYWANRELLPPRVWVVFVARETALNRAFGNICRDVREGLEVIADRCRTSDGR